MTISNRLVVQVIATSAAGVMATAAHARPDFCEGVDAGSQPFSATTVSGAGAVSAINGTLSSTLVTGDFEDMYLIRIQDAANFRAFTAIPDEGVPFDTQLWLFSAQPDPTGFGLLGNDNAPPGLPGEFPGNSLLLPMSDDGTEVLIGPGLYYLAITGVPDVPLSNTFPGLLPIFQFGGAPFEISGPDGPGGGNPIAGWSTGGETGAYRIVLDGVAFIPCGDIACPPGAVSESELCGENTNGGCNDELPAFEPIKCGVTICGTSQAGEDGPGLRDTDWFEIILDEPTRLTTSAVSHFPHGQGLIEYEPGTLGSGDCDDLTGFVDPVALGAPCETSSLRTDCLPAGTYFLLVAQQGFADNLCGKGTNDYSFNVSCVPCTFCIADLDNSGDVGFTDLIQVLAAWGPCAGCNEDLDNDGNVGFTDLLIVLSAWGPCG